ncbi:MAG: clostripain-related cysteine peptidase [Acidimicrobiia bacterium]|nr:clostripain-related cysteine peptidase [Acidimicrobiia bacterium]
MAFLIALVLVVSACTGGDADDRAGTSGDGTAAPGDGGSLVDQVPTPGGDGAQRAAWTFLVYLIGDTDLEPFAVQDLLEMASATGDADVNIVALVDRHPEYTDAGVLNLGDWEDTKLLEVHEGELIEVSGGTELNLGSPDALAGFLEAGIGAYPADHYALVFWNHGAGWPGMGPDETDGLDILDLADISQGLETGLAAAGVDSIDLIGFDACLMATYEVASVVAPHADYMLASQELEPGHGWNYESLGIFATDDDVTSDELGRAIIDGFAAQAEAFGTGSDITLSLLDLSGVEAFSTALSEVTGRFGEDPAGLATALTGARRGLLGFGRNPDPALDSNHVDLGGLLDNLAAVGGPELSTAAANALSALQTMVVANTTGPATRQASGLSIYFPELEDHFRQGYLFLTGDPQWANTLSAFFQAGQELPQDRRATFVEQPEATVQPVFFFDDDGLNVFGPLSEFSIGSVIEATMFVGVVDPDSDAQLFYAEEWMDIETEPVTVTDTGGEVIVDGSPGVFAIHDNSYLELSDGQDTAIAYYALNLDQDTGFGLVDIPLTYLAPGSEEPEEILLSVVVDLESGEIVEEDFYTVDPSGTYGGLTADPQGLIFPELLLVENGEAQWVPTTDVGLFADLPNLQYALIQHEPGTQLYVDMTVWDYGGNSDSTVLLPVVP